MIETVRIQNYKSIADLTLELGRFNVLIGENGCGKTNILEALAFAAEGISGPVGHEQLALRGVRVTRPEMTRGAFLDTEAAESIRLSFDFRTALLSSASEHLELEFAPIDGSASSSWLAPVVVPDALRSKIRDLARSGDTTEQALLENLLPFIMAPEMRRFRASALLSQFAIYSAGFRRPRARPCVS